MLDAIKSKGPNSHKIKSFELIMLAAIILSFVLPCYAEAADSVIVSRGEPFEITVTILTNGSYGVPLQNQLIEFYDQTYDQFIAEAITDELGIAKIEHEFSLSHPKGYTLVNITYRGNESLALAPTCQWVSFIVTSSSRLEIQSNRMKLAPDDTLVFSVSLLDDSQHPIQNAPIQVFCDSELIHKSSTNTTGQVLLEINLQDIFLDSGTHTIQVVYEGNMTSFNRGVSNCFDIDIQRISTSINTINELPELLSLNQTSIITVRAQSEEGALSEVPIDFLIDGELCYKTLTNSTGFAEFSFLPNESFSVGFHTLEIFYEGGQRYKSYSLLYEITIGTEALLEARCASKVIIDSKLSVDIQVSDIFSRPIPYATVYLIDTYSGSSISLFITNETKISLELPITGTIGNRSIQIVVDSDYISYGGQITIFIAVWASTKIDIISSSIFGYAYPKQTIQLRLHLSTQLGNLSNREFLYSISQISDNVSATTDQFGYATIEVTSPEKERSYEIEIIFNGAALNFELSNRCTYAFIVSSRIPLQINHFYYDTNHISGTLSTILQIQALNGTAPEGISVTLNWLSIDYLSITTAEGLLQIQLPMPLTSGIYPLVCHIPATDSIEQFSCVLHLLVTPSDTNASEGIGFYPLLFGISGSFGIPIIPLMRRKSITK